MGSWTKESMDAKSQVPVSRTDSGDRRFLYDESKVISEWLCIGQPNIYACASESCSACQDGVNINLGQVDDIRAGTDRPNPARIYEEFSKSRPDQFGESHERSIRAAIRQSLAHEIAHCLQAEREGGWAVIKGDPLVFELQADILSAVYCYRRDMDIASASTVMGSLNSLRCDVTARTHPDSLARLQGGLAAMTLSGWLKRNPALTGADLYDATRDIASAILDNPGSAVSKAAEWGQKLVEKQ